MASSPPLRIRPVQGVAAEITVPGDKSISHRYAMLAAIARGTTAITNLAPGADVTATIDCLQALGVPIDWTEATAVTVAGRGWTGLAEPSRTLDAANSGTTLRLLAGLLAGRQLAVRLTGDASLRRRPMRRVIEPLALMGAEITSEQERAPLVIRGGQLHGINWRPPIPSAQVKSALMLAGLSATGRTSIAEALPTRDHSERAFPVFGLRADTNDRTVTVVGGQEATSPIGGHLRVPGDPSSAAIWAAAAAAIPGAAIRLPHVCLNPRRLGFVHALRRMGAAIHLRVDDEVGGESVGVIEVRHDGHADCALGPADIPDLIDELPILAARAALGGSLDVTGAAELRVKESDRITALVTGLRALGVDADERPDGFVVRGTRRPTGGTVDAAGDHRLVMAFAIVGLGASADTIITGAEAVAVSYPGFAADLAGLST